MCFGGGGGGGSQSVTQEFKPPEWTQGRWKSYLDAEDQLVNRPYEQSGLPQLAPWNEFQDTSARLMFDKAMEGTPWGNAANGAFMNAASGNYANPYADPLAQFSQQGNQYAGSLGGLASETNPYFGDPYTDQMIKNMDEEMANSFATGTAANSDAKAAMSGAFGGSGHLQQTAANAGALAKQIANANNSVRQQQQQVSLNAWNQGMQNRMGALQGAGSLDAQNMQSRMAALQGAGGLYSQDIQNMLAGAQGGLAADAAYGGDLQGLMGAGNSMNNYVQQLLGQYNNQWQTQQGYDPLMWDQYGAALSRASGSYGGTTQSAPGSSPWAGLLGLGAGAAGMYSLFK